MSHLQIIYVTLITVLQLGVCLPLTQTQFSDAAISLLPGQSAFVSKRTCDALQTHSIRYSVGFDGDEPDVDRHHPVLVDQSLSYYDAQETGYALTQWNRMVDGVQCLEAAARVVNTETLRAQNHSVMTLHFILVNREPNDNGRHYNKVVNVTSFIFNLTAEEELDEEITTSINTDQTSTVTASTSTSASPSIVAGGLELSPGVSAIVAVSVAVAVGSIICSVIIVAIVVTRNRHKPGSPEEGV
jgi:hypothetical protein